MSEFDALAGHTLHCPACGAHLTSLLLCPECGVRYELRRQDRSRVTSGILPQHGADIPEPLPQPGREIVRERVFADITRRLDAAEREHGGPLMTFNGRDALWDALQEAIDTVMYLTQAIMEREHRQPLVRRILRWWNRRAKRVH